MKKTKHANWKMIPIRTYILLLIAFLWLGAIVSAATTLRFVGINMWYIDQKISDVIFITSGNNTSWSILWLNTKSIETWKILTDNMGQTMKCFKQIKWLYSNAKRWNILLPLDQDTLNYLSWSDLTFSGWMCTWLSFWWLSWWLLSGTFTINNDAIYTNTQNVTLNINFAGAQTMSFSNDNITWDGPFTYTNSHPWTMTVLVVDSGYQLRKVYARFYSWTEYSGTASDTIIWDTLAPIISTWYIFNGNTRYYSPNNYYNWTVDIRADVKDINWLNTSTCEYTINNWTNRYSANYLWTSTAGYCYKNGIIWWSDLNIKFKMEDIVSNLWYGVMWTYIYDIAPIITIINPNTSPATGKTIKASTDHWILTMTTWSTDNICDGGRTFIVYSDTTFTGNTDNGKYVCYRAIDVAWNITYALSNMITWIINTDWNNFERVVKWGGIGVDQARWIAVDSAGNSYIAWQFEWTVSFWSKILISSGSDDIFIAKLSSTGMYMRATKWGGISTDYNFSVAVDNGGNSYIAGWFDWTANFWTTKLISSGYIDTFIAKLDSNWNYLRATKWGGAFWDEILGVAVDNIWNSYIAWLFTDSTGYFWAYQVTNSGQSDVFIAKLSSTGMYMWATKWGGDLGDYAESIAVDSVGNSYIAGIFDWTVSFWATTLISNSSMDAFIAKLDSNWNYLRATKLGGSNIDRAHWITVDNAGNSYVIGRFGWTAQFWSKTLISNGLYDAFITKLDSNWNYLRATKWGGVDWDSARWIAVDNAGNSYVAWGFNLTGYFWPIILNSNGLTDAFIAKLDSNWNYLRAIKWGSIDSDVANWIAVDSAGNSYVAGQFNWTAQFWSKTLISSGGYDNFVGKICYGCNN